MVKLNISQSGTALIEGLIAMLIFVIAILGMAGLAVNLMQQDAASTQRMNAALLADELLNVAILDSANASCYTLPAGPCGNAAATQFMANWLTEVNQDLPGGIAPAITLDSNNVMTVTLFWRRSRDVVAHKYTMATQVGP